MDNKRNIPGWLIVVAIIATGVGTWLYLRRRSGGLWPAATAASASTPIAPPAALLRPPALSLARSLSSPASPPSRRRARQRLSLPTPPRPAALTQIKALRRVPVINAGATAKHGYRGPCTRCHMVLGNKAARVPTIRATASLPHKYPGGVCANCHVIARAGASNAAATVARTRRVRLPTEGEWLGLEVAPLTKLTASQYDIPAGVRGVVVTEAEASAAKAGFKPGDVVVGIGSTAVADMRTFLRVTNKGKSAGGVVNILRKKRPLSLTLGTPPTAPAAQRAPTAPTPPAASRAAPTRAPARAALRRRRKTKPSGNGGSQRAYQPRAF